MDGSPLLIGDPSLTECQSAKILDRIHGPQGEVRQNEKKKPIPLKKKVYKFLSYAHATSTSVRSIHSIQGDGHGLVVPVQILCQSIVLSTLSAARDHCQTPNHSHQSAFHNLNVSIRYFSEIDSEKVQKN